MFPASRSWSEASDPRLSHKAVDWSRARKGLEFSPDPRSAHQDAFADFQSPQVKGPFPARRIHFKILTLLALSPTYSYDLEKLRMELAWDEQSYGNLQQYLSNVRHEGKQLYTLVTTENGVCRLHLIKDIYLNAVSQKLRAHHEKHYKTTHEILSPDALKKFLNWDCSTRAFKDWLANHGLSKLLAPPTNAPEDLTEGPNRPVRPHIIRTSRELSSALGFVKQQYNLISLTCYETLDLMSGFPRLALVRLTQANKQVLLLDIVALTEEARRQCKAQPFYVHVSEFVQDLTEVMVSEDIRKCVWNFKSHRQLWKDHLGIEVNGLIDLYPICSYFFPELVDTPGDNSGMPCPPQVAEKLCPQAWGKGTEIPFTVPVADWGLRPLTQNMVTRAGGVAVGVLLDVRKGVRTELATRVNERMTQVSSYFHNAPSEATLALEEAARPDLASLLSMDSSPKVSTSPTMETPYSPIFPDMQSLFAAPEADQYNGYSYVLGDNFSSDTESPAWKDSMVLLSGHSPARGLSDAFRRDPFGSQDFPRSLEASLIADPLLVTPVTAATAGFRDAATSARQDAPDAMPEAPVPSASLAAAFLAGVLAVLIARVTPARGIPLD